MKEIFRTIDGYDGRYSISNKGNLFNHYKNKLVTSFTKTPSGYYIYHITYKHKAINLYIHKEVAKAFPEICGEYVDGLQAHHIDSNKENNNAENLILVTQHQHRLIHFHENPKLSIGLKPHPVGFKFSKEYCEKISKLRKGKNKGKDNYASKPVLMIDKNDGHTIMEFESIHAAGEYLGDMRKQANIWKCITGKILSAYGYKWEYKKAG